MGYPTLSRVAIGKKIAAAALTAAVAGAVCAPGVAMAADANITPKGEVQSAATLADGVYAVDMQSNNTMFKPDEGLLRVKDGKAFASFVHSSYTFMYLGTGAEYEAARDAGTLESDPNYIKGTPVTIKDYTGKTLKAGSRFEFEIANLNEAFAITTQSPSSSKTLARQICFDYDGSLTAGAEVFATVNVDGVNAMDVDADSTTDPAAMKNRSVVVKDLDGDGKVTASEAMVGVEDKYHQGAVQGAVWGEKTEVVAYALNGEAKAADDEVADGASLEASVYGDGAFSAEVTPSSMFVAAEPVVYVKGGKISGISVTSTSLSKMFNGTVAEAEAAEESALLPVTADTGYSKSNKVSAIRYTLPASKLGQTLEFAGFSSSKSTWGKKTLTINALTTKAANCTLSVVKNDVYDTDLRDAPVVGVDVNADGVVSLNEVMGAAYKKYLNGNVDAAEGTDVFAEIWGADATLFSSINRAKFAAVSGSAEIANGDDIVIRDTKATQVVIVHAPSINKTYGDAAFFVKSGSAKTALTFKSSNTSVAKVDANGKVTIVAPGTANITISAVETDVYKSASNTIKLTVAKKAQKLAVSKAKKSAKRGKSTSAIAVSGAKSTKSFKKVSGSKFLTVNKTTGKIKVSKKAKKGKTYSIKVKVSASANKYYLSDAKTVTIKVKVK